MEVMQRVEKLHYIVFLHQTTTMRTMPMNSAALHYIVFLHQTTTYTTYITDIQLFENNIGRYEVV